MLDPDQRTLFVDALRPPTGMTLGRAVGTTFTLDLEALMIVPVALATFDVSEEEPGDPIMLLETVRRYAERIDLFCQAGQIGVPRSYQAMLTHLEESIHPVKCPNRGYIFHPKLWVLHYESPDNRSHLRVLVASRNLTFDRSWDLLLRLDEDRRYQPLDGLADFLASLPGMSVNRAVKGRTEAVHALSEVVRTTGLAPAPPFTKIRGFHSFGTGPSSAAGPLAARADRVLVVAPFVGDSGLRRLHGDARLSTVVSRQESLDDLNEATIDQFDEVFVFNPAAAQVTDENATTEGDTSAPGFPLTGLHAKLFVTERGSDTLTFVGSANATDAAFTGNVEVLVEMRGRTSDVGVDALLGDDERGLRSMLEPYVRSDPPPENEVDKANEKLGSAVMQVASETYTADVTDGSTDDTFGLRLRSKNLLRLADGITARWWPLSLPAANALEASSGARVDLNFGSVSLAAITSFFGLELSTTAGRQRVTATAVINTTLVGAPEDRRERVLTSLLRDRGDVMRYLLLLLLFAREGGGDDVARTWEAITKPGGGADGQRQVDFPLFESMIRALATNPESLDRVARLIDDLRATEEGTALLPEGLDTVWDPIWQARQEML